MKNIELIDPNFKIKLEETKNEVFEYFKEKGIDVNELLPLNEVLQYNTFFGAYRIYVSDKFPKEYAGIVTDIIKKHFPK